MLTGGRGISTWEGLTSSDWREWRGGGESNIPSRFMRKKLDKLRLHGTLSASTHFTFSNQTPDSLSGAQTINVLSIEADSNDMGWVNDPSPVKLKIKVKMKVGAFSGQF